MVTWLSISTLPGQINVPAKTEQNQPSGFRDMTITISS